MAKVSLSKQHDWMRLRVAFPNGQVANVNCSRNGETVKIDPDNAASAEKIALILKQSWKRCGEVGYPFKNLGEVLDGMEGVAKSATTLDGFLDGLVETLQVKGERPQPKGLANAPAATVVDMKAARGGYTIKARFPNGESFDLKLNKASVGILSDPPIMTRDDAVMKFLFALKSMGVELDQTAYTVKETALEAASYDEWFEALRTAYAPAPRR